MAEDEARERVEAMRLSDAEVETLWKAIVIGLRRDHPEFLEMQVWDTPATPYEIGMTAMAVLAASHLTRPLGEVSSGEAGATSR